MNAIGQLRRKCGLTQKQLAVAVGKSKSAVEFWEQGRYCPSESDLHKIAEALGCSAADLNIPVSKKPVRVKSEAEKAVEAKNREKAAPYIERRIALGLSQKRLAQKAGVSVPTISGMETGRYAPCWETRQKIRRVLGMPEESCCTKEERNALFFELEEEIRWLIRKNKRRIYAVYMDADDLYQDLVVCALRAIDRFQPDGKATLKTYVERNMEFLLERKLVQSCMHGLSGKVHYPLPNIAVFSLEALMEEGLQLEGYDGAFEYNAEDRPWCSEHQGR